MADMLREMSENMQERRYREEQEYEEEEYEDYADEEDEDSLAREEAERERRREEQRKKIMRERRAQAKRNERRARELEAQKQAQKEEKRRRKSDEQKKRREAEERAEDERILRSSNRKTLNHVALEPTIPARHKLDDMHEITLMPEGDVTRLDAAARVQEVVYEEEVPVPEYQEVQEIRIRREEEYVADAEEEYYDDPVEDSYEEQEYLPEEETGYETQMPEEESYVPDEVAVVTVVRENGREKESIRPIVQQTVATPAPTDITENTNNFKKTEDLPTKAPEVDITGMPDPVTERTHNKGPAEEPTTELKVEEAQAKAETQIQAPVKKKAKYEKPPISLLNDNKKKGGGDSDQYLKETALLLQQTLKTFGVSATVTDISQGPSVTRFELQLGEGIKVNKIVNLADDLKLNLAAQDIRIEAPIPGKAAVGIEIPNKERLPVSIRELIESQEFRKADSKLSYVVGKDISGHTIVSDIAKMPHLLVAGSTGSGKSVFTNSIILSILYEANPDEVKMILVDPKVVEFSVYNGIPHLLLPVVTDPRKANAALAWAVAEMERRYKVFAEHNVRAIKAYNELVEAGKVPAIDGPPEKMPQIVIVVDELADLMMVASKDVEASICRIAQLARAAGIHLIIATQRPSVDVITGLIKANMPSRVALKVSSGVDSRTILDSVGAERLLGYGDMLFYPQGYSKPLRVQGAFVSDEEVQRVTEFLKNNAAESQIYDEEILNKISNLSGEAQTGDTSAEAESGSGDDLDSYFDDACRFVVEKEKASSGMLQRVFKVGYNRAARIVDQMEVNGVVGPEEGTKPRKVLMDSNQLELFLRERHKK
ncbi:MAG: DNA translocase FtsK [Lachnospiraceae bacterium]|nr:DNA translocase FtsK [Lachnospiraceae bacterium]